MTRIKHSYTEIHDPIEIQATSVGGKFKVQAFRWKQRQYVVREQCMINKAMHGHSPVWFFSVLTGSGSYKLRLDTDTLEWWMEEVYSELV